MRFRIKNQPQLEIWLNALADEIERVEKGRPRLNAGVNVLIDEGPEGFTITGTATGDGGSSPDLPFQLTGFIEADTAYISCTPGLIDDIVPTMGGISLLNLPAPKIAVTGASGVLWVKNTLDAAGVITASIIEAGSAMPANSSVLAYRMLGSFTSASGQFTSVVSLLHTNQAHRRCNGSSTWGSA
jgi:hypothetical protein